MEERRLPGEENDEEKGEVNPNRQRDPEESARLATERIEEIHQYLRDREAHREVVVRTVTPSGQELDWIPVESQVPHGQLASPPSEDGMGQLDLGIDKPADAKEYRPHEPLQFELTRTDAEQGPKGTVPTVRRLVERIRPTGSLQDFLSKHGRAARILPDDDPREFASPDDGTVHKYAYSAQYVTLYGSEGNINAWDPYLEWSDEFSLGQVAVVRGTGSGKQTIESGHQEYRDLYGDWVPHLFVFYTTNGYTSSGDDEGGYNQDVDGWVQYSSTIYPEARSSPLSTFGGTQYIMNLKWQLWEGNWWLRCNGTWIGYYPASLFSSSGLRNQAEKVAWYGEVVDSGGHSGTTATDMGNGHWPYEGWQHCAYMSNLYYQSSSGGALSRYNPSSIYASNWACYDIVGHFSNTGSWGPYFWWGGSGRNSGCP